MKDVSRAKPRTLLLAAIATVIVGVVAVFPAFTRAPAPPSKGDPVAVAFTYFDGRDGSLAELRGRPVVLNFWASWCPACVSEMPDFQSVSERFEGEVHFLGMNMQEVSLEAALDLIEATGVEYPLAHDPDGAIFQEFGGVAMPTTVFLTLDGRVASVHAGAIFADDLAARIEQLLPPGG